MFILCRKDFIQHDKDINLIFEACVIGLVYELFCIKQRESTQSDITVYMY